MITFHPVAKLMVVEQRCSPPQGHLNRAADIHRGEWSQIVIASGRSIEYAGAKRLGNDSEARHEHSRTPCGRSVVARDNDEERGAQASGCSSALPSGEPPAAWEARERIATTDGSSQAWLARVFGLGSRAVFLDGIGRAGEPEPST